MIVTILLNVAIAVLGIFIFLLMKKQDQFEVILYSLEDQIKENSENIQTQLRESQEFLGLEIEKVRLKTVDSHDLRKLQKTIDDGFELLKDNEISKRDRRIEELQMLVDRKHKQLTKERAKNK